MTGVNLGTGRIVVIVALLVVGAAVLANGFADGEALQPDGGTSGSPVASDSPSGTASHTGSPTAAATPAAEVEGVLIQVFNGTNVAGLGATAQTALETKGYTINADALDAPVKPPDSKTIVYFRGGGEAAQNESNATNLAKKNFKGAKVEELDPSIVDLVKKSTQVVVVVGDDYAATIA
jgi:hypothetical protein